MGRASDLVDRYRLRLGDGLMFVVTVALVFAGGVEDPRWLAVAAIWFGGHLVLVRHRAPAPADPVRIGMVIEDSSTPIVRDNDVHGFDRGIEVRRTIDPTIEGNTID